MSTQTVTISDQWLTINGLRIHYFTAGEAGSPVVLLHGAGVDSAKLSWELALGPLAQEHRVFAPDLPGYGQSDKPDVTYNTDFYLDFLAHFLDALQLPQVALVGLSMEVRLLWGLRCVTQIVSANWFPLTLMALCRKSPGINSHICMSSHR
jgi:esterase/lipase